MMTCRAVLFVDNSAAPGGDGFAWISALQDLQNALDITVAAPPGLVSEIRVAGGVYVPSAQTDPNDVRTATFQLLNGVMLHGGYAGLSDPNNPDTRDIDLYETILSGDLMGNDVGDAQDPSHGENCYHVVTANGTDRSAVLDGFVIRGGNADASSAAHEHGGGICNVGGSPTVSRCRLLDNYAYYEGWWHGTIAADSR